MNIINIAKAAIKAHPVIAGACALGVIALVIRARHNKKKSQIAGIDDLIDTAGDIIFDGIKAMKRDMAEEGDDDQIPEEFEKLMKGFGAMRKESVDMEADVSTDKTPSEPETDENDQPAKDSEEAI